MNLLEIMDAHLLETVFPKFRKVDINGDAHTTTPLSEHLPILEWYGNINRYTNQEYAYENISEGLIVSYDISKCETYLKKRFPEIIGIDAMTDSRGLKDSFATIGVRGACYRYRKITECIENLLGWFVPVIKVRVSMGDCRYKEHVFCCYKTDKQEKEITSEKRLWTSDTYELTDFLRNTRNILSTTLVVESKYVQRYYPEDDEKMYHITSFHNKERISRQGLVPRSSGNYPDKIYLSPSVKEIQEMINGKFGTSEKLIVLEVYGLTDLELYFDPRNNRSYFTYDSISPEHIKVVAEGYRDEDLMKKVRE